MLRQTILFDFDGTLADTLEAIVEITNRLSGEFGYDTIRAEEIAKLRNLTSKQIIKTSPIPISKLPFLLQMIKMELKHEIDHLKPIAGMKDVLKTLKKQGFQIGILSSNSKENVRGFVEKHRWESLFDFIYSGATIFGKNKIIKNFLRKENLSPSDIIYIGDETRDIEAARKSNIKVIAVSWGFNSREVLAQRHPDVLVDSPEQLIEAIAQLQASVTGEAV
ncbi:HAD-IA family hydrolase [Oxynema aestuarii]|jgi:phosphoglycolate phosphatase|uniref:HAD-IA family hydrolase n=1 Tax=Oxynema aestuarii AP17 TaxID=2064643 RepID=A0A6H1U262_9CYAN|nr:HAD-IA family hydrolase [Oxynema aestuarii]QIZ71709.1 HAD-IA family hydrolase [Oxynema aestuarii AP17]